MSYADNGVYKGDVCRMSEFTLKQADERDVDAVCRIERTCFSDPWGEDTVKQMLGSPFIKIFCDVDAKSGEAASYLVISETDCVEILKIAVMPDYRRKKLGTFQLERAKRAALNTFDKRIILEVRSSNVGAIAFYEKNGFKTDGIRKNYYKNPTEDAILMSLDLK